MAKNFDHATPDFFMHRFGIIYFHLLSPEKITGRNSAISSERQTDFLNKKKILVEPLLTQSILVFSFRVVILSASMTWTTAPHPAPESRSNALVSAWEVASKICSASMSSDHRASHMPGNTK